MKVTVLNETKTEVRKIDLPRQFSEPVRKDLIKKAVVAIDANLRQPYGADPMAGKRASAELSRRRKKYRGSYGIGISRVPRKILSRRGTRMNWVGAFAPGTVKGRRAHPPKPEKIWSHKMNTKERRKAIRSALSATVIKAIVEQRGHKVPDVYPFLMDSKIENMEKTKDILTMLDKIGLGAELERVSLRKIRPGIGTMRGRKYRTKTGPLLVVSEKCKLMEAAKNIPGIDIVKVDKLNAKHLAPGVAVGRLTIYTDKAIERIEKEALFIDKIKVKKEKPKQEKKPKVAKKDIKAKPKVVKAEPKVATKEVKVEAKKPKVEAKPAKVPVKKTVKNGSA